MEVFQHPLFLTPLQSPLSILSHSAYKSLQHPYTLVSHSGSARKDGLRTGSCNCHPPDDGFAGRGRAGDRPETKKAAAVDLLLLHNILEEQQ